MTVAVLAEKPSVARDIARVLGARRRQRGALVGNGYVVTWAIGHLASLAQPHEIEAQWRRWNLAQLPMIPAHWPLRVYDKTRDQFEIVKRILCDPETAQIVCATDAGREGELIFRFIYQAAGATVPVKRLWISSLTDEAIQRGFADLRPAREFDALADAARGRSRADWLVGMNLSRAYTLRQPGQRDMLSVGRVQTPTLAILVQRELAIRDFVSEPYKEVRVVFRPLPDPAPGDAAQPASPGEASTASYVGVYFRPPQRREASPPNANRADPDALRRDRRLPAEGEQAQRIADRALRGRAEIASIDGRQRRLPPPLLYDLTELQRHANRLYGNTAKHTLDIAQALYEKKLLSYPRTDSRALTRDVAKTLPQVVAAISPPYGAQLAQGTGRRPLGPRFVNDAKVGDHHALIPTASPASRSALGRDEQRIYDLVCRRLLAAWHEDHLYRITTVITTIAQPAGAQTEAEGEAERDAETNAPIIDPYRSTGSKVDQLGWRVLDPLHPAAGRDARKRGGQDAPRADGAGGPQLPSILRAGQSQQVLESQIDDKRTRPPPRLSEANLLTAMETAGRELEDKELSVAMRESGLGTPATRAGIIETLLERGYLQREKKTLRASDKGIGLIELVHPHAKSPAMTGRWEARLRRIQHGADSLECFMSEIEQFVRDVVAQIKRDAPTTAATAPKPIPGGREAPASLARPGARQQPTPPTPPTPGPEIGAASRPTPVPTAPEALLGLLQDRFGFERFRPHQEEVCRSLSVGHDVLLVMPTGAGKSLCYQLPGVARAGTSLVVSPLIALMEDQVFGLRERGFAAERIHSGRSREESRQVCLDYLAGRLDFLFVAPERLGVAGFPEMLARRKPVLIAIDEAHCISQWGHDFRPDYRMLKERIALLRPVPIVGLTATATPRVQRDIVEQLAIPAARQFIHGFRRTNIAIEVVELAPSLRNDTAARLLQPAERRPAIVYAPTRKKAEALVDVLGEAFPAAAYHAGMNAGQRDKVHSAFLAGTLDVVVATVAFGMGIDKADVRSVVHLALPGSVESYYQEIGRAGRDGLPSRAFLLHGYSDRRTHAWFLARDYPDPADLAAIFEALGDHPIGRAQLQGKLGLAPETFERALEKLWIHGGALVSPDEAATRGHDGWRGAYRDQLEHRRAQLDAMAGFAKSRSCRMLRLIDHFGDRADSAGRCGQCDICAPKSCVAAEFTDATPSQQAAMERILKTLASQGTASSGRLHRDLFGEDFDRGHFEALLAALHRAGYLHLEQSSFESEGRTIEFSRPQITASGRRAEAAELAQVRVAAPAAAGPRSGRRPKTSRAKRKPTRKPGSAAVSSRAGKARGKRAARKRSPQQAAVASALCDSLRGLRLAEARRRGIPAFRIFSDKVLEAIAGARPTTRAELLAIKGVGPAFSKNYGERILRRVAEATPPNREPSAPPKGPRRDP